MNAIKRELKLHWREDLFLYAIYWGIFAAMAGLVCLIMILTDSDTYADMGCFMSMLSGAVILLIRFVLWQPYHFNLTVSMGQTRAACILATAAHSALLTALFAATLLLFEQIEHFLYSRLFPTAINEISLADILTPRPLVLVAAALWVITFVLGGMIARYGRKAWWIVWAIWMFCCLVLPRLIVGDREDASILGLAAQRFANAANAFLSGITPAVWLILAVLAAAAALFAGVRMYLRAEVRY